MLCGGLVWGQFVRWIGKRKVKGQGSSQETLTVIEESTSRGRGGGNQGFNWGRETVEMEEDGHMGDIKRQDPVSVRAFPHERVFCLLILLYLSMWNLSS